MLTLVSNDSTISEDVPIDYENKVAIYDDYCDDMYAIRNNVNHETCHHDFNFNWIMPHMTVILLSLLPLFRMRRILLMWRVVKFLCMLIMKRMLYVMVILSNSFMMLLKIIMREEYMLEGIAIISSFLSMCWKSWSFACFTFLC